MMRMRRRRVLVVRVGARQIDEQITVKKVREDVGRPKDVKSGGKA